MFMYDPNSPLLRSSASKGSSTSPDANARFAEDRMLDAVIWCEILPCEIVTEADMMTRLGITRAASRAGLARLGFAGWAAPQPRTGWLILPITGELIGHVLSARRIAEPALADVRLSADAKSEIEQIAGVLQALDERREVGVVATARHYANRVDDLLLDALDPLTARHLRHLWQHSERIIRFLEDSEQERVFWRSDVIALINAVLTDDKSAIVAARNSLIVSLEAFCLPQFFKSSAPLPPGGGVLDRAKMKPTINNRSET